MDPGTDAREAISGRLIYLKRGFVPVVARSQRDIAEGMPVERALAREAAFFSRHPAYRPFAGRCGVSYLSRVLSHLMLSAIKSWLPRVRAEVSLMLQYAEQELRELGSPVGSVDAAGAGQTVLRLLTRYASNYGDMVEGRTHADASADMLTRMLFGGARIQEHIRSRFALAVDDWMDGFVRSAATTLPSAEILMALRNSSGPRPALFIPEQAFVALARRFVVTLKEQGRRLVQWVYDELRRVADQCQPPDLERFGDLRERAVEVVHDLLRSAYVPCLSQVDALCDFELAHVNTLHPDFAGVDGAAAAVAAGEDAALFYPPHAPYDPCYEPDDTGGAWQGTRGGRYGPGGEGDEEGEEPSGHLHDEEGDEDDDAGDDGGDGFDGGSRGVGSRSAVEASYASSEAGRRRGSRYPREGRRRRSPSNGSGPGNSSSSAGTLPGGAGDPIALGAGGRPRPDVEWATHRLGVAPLAGEDGGAYPASRPSSGRASAASSASGRGGSARRRSGGQAAAYAGEAFSHSSEDAGAAAGGGGAAARRGRRADDHAAVGAGEAARRRGGSRSASAGSERRSGSRAEARHAPRSRSRGRSGEEGSLLGAKEEALFAAKARHARAQHAGAASGGRGARAGAAQDTEGEEEEEGGADHASLTDVSDVASSASAPAYRRRQQQQQAAAQGEVWQRFQAAIVPDIVGHGADDPVPAGAVRVGGVHSPFVARPSARMPRGAAPPGVASPLARGGAGAGGSPSRGAAYGVGAGGFRGSGSPLGVGLGVMGGLAGGEGGSPVLQPHSRRGPFASPGFNSMAVPAGGERHGLRGPMGVGAGRGFGGGGAGGAYVAYEVGILPSRPLPAHITPADLRPTAKEKRQIRIIRYLLYSYLGIVKKGYQASGRGRGRRGRRGRRCRARADSHSLAVPLSLLFLASSTTSVRVPRSS